jgi:uncharacterized protein YggE
MSDKRTIIVSGQGEVSAPPDLAHLRLGVSVTSRETETAMRTANERIAAVQAALQSEGVEEDDISLGSFSITAVYDHRDGRRTLRGYQVSHNLSITVREIDRTGALLSIAVHAGADDVRGVSFSVEDPAPLIDRARELAYDNALHKAKHLASLSGHRLAPVHSIRETSREPVPIERHNLRSMASAAPLAERPPDVPVNPENADFSVQMEIVWELAS